MTATGAAPRYTLILVREHWKPVRTFAVSPRWVLHGAASAVVDALTAAALGASLLGHDRALRLARSENRSLREENAHLRSQMQAVEERVAHIAGTLDRVERREGSLRAIADQPEPPSSGDAPRPARPPEGGAEHRPPATSSANTGRREPLLARFAKLEDVASRQESSLQALEGYFEEQRSTLASTPAAWPTRGWVTSDFGVRLDPYTAERMMHRGLDIATPKGQTVYAPSDATVVSTAAERGYGKVLVLDHGNGVSTRYGHLSEIFVKPGERVKRGARVAAVGSTGRSTGPHLHYEVRVNGAAENPRKFLLE